MTVIEELQLLTKYAKRYRKDAQKSLERNNHMNDIQEGELVQQRIIDAILVDYINFVGVQNCCDYAMCVSDLSKD